MPAQDALLQPRRQARAAVVAKLGRLVEPAAQFGVFAFEGGLPILQHYPHWSVRSLFWRSQSSRFGADCITVDEVASGGYMRSVQKVGLKTLKNKLSEYVRLAAAGETIVVTDRGRAVAEIVPSRRQPESVIERGIREGWIRPARRGADWPPLRKPIPGLTLETLMAELDRDREDRC